MLIGHSLTVLAYSQRLRRQAEAQKSINDAWEALRIERELEGGLYDSRNREPVLQIILNPSNRFIIDEEGED